MRLFVAIKSLRKWRVEANSHMRSDDAIIDLIYASAVGERQWIEVVSALDEGVPGGATLLFSHDVNQQGAALSASHNFEDDWTQAFNEHYAAINPFMPAAAVRPVGKGVVAEEMLARDKLTKTEFYNDFLVPFGRPSAIGITVLREAGQSLLLSTVTAEDDPDLIRPYANRLTRLAPHFRRGFDIYRRRFDQTTDHELVEAIDAVGLGVMVVAPNGTLRSASAVAQDILASGGLAVVSPTGRLSFRNAAAGDALDALLLPSSKGRTIALTVDDLAITMRSTASSELFAYLEGPSVVIILQKRSIDLGSLDLGAIISIYKLTIAEERVVRGVLEGLTLGQIAMRIGRSRETVKSQLRAVYSKTGASGREALIALALRQGG